MDILEKAKRIAELLKIRQDADTEMESLIQGAPMKRTWSRKPKIETPKQEGSPAS